MEQALSSVLSVSVWVFASALAAASLLALAVHLCRCVPKFAMLRLRRTTLAVLAALAAVATIEAQKRGGGGESTPQQGEPEGGSAAIPTEGCVMTNTLHFSGISVGTNEIALALAWPADCFAGGTTLDIFAASSLVAATWTWQCAHDVEAGDTNWMVSVSRESDFRFFRASARDDPGDMRDTDGDGIPDVYELHGGTNPYVPDYAAAPKLTVGPNGAFGTVGSAVEASTAYSIIELDPSVRHEIGEHGFGCQIPVHPIMVTAPRPYAVVRSGGLSAFMLATNTTSRTVFRNLYLLLDAKSSFQTGFWCGGSLPMSSIPASATFENIYVRMPNPGVQYRGWLFYAKCAERVSIQRCVLNAAGATWVIGIDAYDPPPTVIDGCSFVNFPSDDVGGNSCGLLLRTAGSGVGGTEVTLLRTLFDESFTNAWPVGRFDSASPGFLMASGCILPRPFPEEYPLDSVEDLSVTNAALAWVGVPCPDSPSVSLDAGALAPVENDPAADEDSDGFADYDEIYILGTDPYLADSDNDGETDWSEIGNGTNPADPHSFTQLMTVTVTNTVSFAHPVYVAWGYSATGWEGNGPVSIPGGHGSVTYTNAAAQGATYVKAYCDLNGNGEYDASHDILLVREIPHGSTAHLGFAFGDVDGDGVSDAQERSDATDPYDAGNFRFAVTVKVANDDNVTMITNYLAYGFASTGWETNGVVSFAKLNPQPILIHIGDIVTAGSIYAKCYRDFNGNGIYDSGVDALYVRQIGDTYNGREYSFAFGDFDGDSVLDSIELDEGTDPLDQKNYCFHMTTKVWDIFHTTNRLTLTATFGTNVVYGPIVVTGGSWQASLGHLVVTNRETLRLDFWDDANGNGVFDESETVTRVCPKITGHSTTDYALLPLGAFDADGNGLLDAWETQTGLDGMPNRGAYSDSDGDGLTDFLEYIAGTNPLVPDGSNTLLSVMSRSVDDKLAGKSAANSLDVFANYPESGYSHVFEPNTNCWTYGVDLTCCSMWNDGPTLSACGPTQTAVTAISPRHVIYAAHYDYLEHNHVFQHITTEALLTMPADKVYYFRGRSGQIYGRHIVARKSIGGDIAIGLLDEALPEDDVLPAYVMPTNFVDYVYDGKQLPVLTIDQQEKAIVRSSTGFNLHTITEFTGSNMPIGNRGTFNKTVFIGGDSSSPKFFVVGNTPVLIGVLHTGSGHGSFVTQYLLKIEAAMDELLPSSGCGLNVLDLSGYETISPYE